VTNAELVELLRLMPPSAPVIVAIRENVEAGGILRPLYEFREAMPDTVVYSRGRVLLQLDE
jgi:hypothetical protein